MIHIAFFEDNKTWFARLESIFANHDITAKGWRDYKHFQQNLLETKPKIVLLDIHIDGNPDAGLQALAAIKKERAFKHLKVLMLTDDTHRMEEAFQKKANGYIAKEDIRDQIEFIQDLMKEHFISDTITKNLIQSYQSSDEIDLNEREKMIISLSALDKTIPEIARQLKLERSTIETYMKNIRGKMDCHTIQGVVAKAILNKMIDVSKLMV
jgi:DNA-binding NarL/FixJ family response regulator